MTIGFLKRLFGGAGRDAPASRTDGSARGGEASGSEEAPASDAQLDAFERERERQLLREDAERQDELTQRQQRYADYAWTPPPQGGEKRAEDFDRGGREE